MGQHQQNTTPGPVREAPYSRAIPLPTRWPMMTALGVCMLFAGLVTSVAVSVVGGLLSILGVAGWFCECFPQERTEPIEPTGGMEPVVPAPSASTILPARRRVYPEEVHPVRAGIRGGLAGGVAMALVAMAWGVAEHGSVWFPINLLVGVVTPSMAEASPETLAAFNGGWLLDAIIIHGILCLLVGPLATIALAMMPSRPILLSAVVVPAVLTCLAWPMLALVNPALEQHISWPWFIASEVAFGAVCGLVVSRAAKIPAMASEPLAARIGIERSEGGER